MIVPHRNIPINRCRMSEGNVQSLLGKYNSNYCCRQDPLMDGRINGGKFEEKLDFCVVSVSPSRYLSTQRKKTLILLLGTYQLKQVINLIPSIIRCIAIMTL